MNEVEMVDMSLVLYALVAGSLMFAMVCGRPNITQTMRVVNKHKANPRNY